MIHMSDRKPRLIGTDSRKKFVNKLSPKFLKSKDIESYSRLSLKEDFAGRFNSDVCKVCC